MNPEPVYWVSLAIGTAVTITLVVASITAVWWLLNLKPSKRKK